MVWGAPACMDLCPNFMHGYLQCLVATEHGGFLPGNICVAARVSNVAMRSIAPGDVPAFCSKPAIVNLDLTVSELFLARQSALSYAGEGRQPQRLVQTMLRFGTSSWPSLCYHKKRSRSCSKLCTSSSATTMTSLPAQKNLTTKATTPVPRRLHSQRPQPSDRTRCLCHFSEPKAFVYTVFNYISNIFEVWVTARASFGFGSTQTMLGIAQLGSNAMKATPVIRVATTRGVNAMINNVKVNGGTLTHARLIADALNEYFVNVGPKLADQIPESEVNPIDFLDQPGPSVFRFRSIRCHEVSKLIPG